MKPSLELVDQDSDDINFLATTLQAPIPQHLTIGNGGHDAIRPIVPMEIHPQSTLIMLCTTPFNTSTLEKNGAFEELALPAVTLDCDFGDAI